MNYCDYRIFPTRFLYNITQLMVPTLEYSGSMSPHKSHLSHYCLVSAASWHQRHLAFWTSDKLRWAPRRGVGTVYRSSGSQDMICAMKKKQTERGRHHSAAERGRNRLRTG